MIKTIKLKFGRGFDSPPEEIVTTPVTVFVGPNNSGKSKVLAEINEYCSRGEQNATNVIIESIEFNAFDEVAVELAEEKIKKIHTHTYSNDESLADNIIFQVPTWAHSLYDSIPRQRFLDVLQNPNSQPEKFCKWYLAYNTLILDGHNRINLIEKQSAGDL